MMNNVALLIGGNQGNRHMLIEEATALIADRIGAVVLASAVYETEPWGDFGEERPQAFLNRGLWVSTSLEAKEVLHESLRIEAELGRRRPAERTHYHSRTMDIDLIFFNHDVIDTPELQIPHPRMHLRRFVLEPLVEIIPNYCHPVFHKTIRQLLDELS